MKLTKHRLKEIISEELDSLDEATTSFDLFDRSGQPRETDPQDLIDDVAVFIGEAGNQLAGALETLGALTSDPHKIGEFVALQTRVKMAQLAIEDVMERFVKSKQNFDRWREEG